MKVLAWIITIIALVYIAFGVVAMVYNDPRNIFVFLVGIPIVIIVSWALEEVMK